MRMVKLGILEILLVLAVPAVFAQVTLPTDYTGPWQHGVPPSGWVFSGLGFDYNPDYDGLNDGAAKFQNTDNSITIHFDVSAGAVSYWIRGLSFVGGTFSVEESVDGNSWSSLQTYTAPPTNATYQTHFPSLEARYLRFFYTEKGTGNVGIDGILIARFVQPVLSEFVAGGISTVTVLETVLGRTYVLESTPVLDLDPVQWMQIDSDAGSGGSLDLQDLSPTNAIRFYRVRDATP